MVQSLVYSFVARGTEILSEYTERTGNFTRIAAKGLQNFQKAKNEFTYFIDGYSYYYIFADELTYCVVAAGSTRRQFPMAYLERIKDEFTKKYGGGKALTAVANSLDKDFGPNLKEQMQYCMKHPEEISKIAQVNDDVTEVQGVMIENIENDPDHGRQIELLVDKTENLRSQVLDHGGQIELLLDGTENLRSQELALFYFVAREKLVVAKNEQTCDKDIMKLAEKFIGLFPITPEEETYVFTYGGLSFIYAVHDVLTHCVVTKQSMQEHILMSFLEKLKLDFESLEESPEYDFGLKIDENIKSFNGNPREFIGKLKLKKVDRDAKKIETIQDLAAQVLAIRNEQIVLDEGTLKIVKATRNKVVASITSWNLIKNSMETHASHLEEALAELNRAYHKLSSRLDIERKSKNASSIQIKDKIKDKGKNPKGGSCAPKRKWTDKEVQHLKMLIDKKVIPGEKPKRGRADDPNKTIAKEFRKTFDYVSELQCIHKIQSIKKKMRLAEPAIEAAKDRQGTEAAKDMQGTEAAIVDASKDRQTIEAAIADASTSKNKRKPIKKSLK